MASITSLGVGSGLDISGLTQQLVDAERAPTEQRLDRREESVTAKVSALGSIKSALADFQDTLFDLKLQTTFIGTQKATSSNDSLVTATAAFEAEENSYQVEVLSVAQQHRMASDISAGYDSSTTFGATAGDNLKIDLGSFAGGTFSGDSFEVDLGTARTLSGIASAINQASENPGVTAKVLTNANGNQSLVIEADESGSDQVIRLSTDAGAGDLQDLVNGFATTNTGVTIDYSAANDGSDLDAQIKFDGVELSSHTNTFEDIVTGVTLDVLQAEIGTESTLTIEKEDTTSSVTEKLQAMVDAYNTMMTDTINPLVEYDQETQSAGALMGDSMARTLISQITNTLFRPVEGLEGDFNSVGAIGIELNRDGTVSLDSSRLAEVLSGEGGKEQLAELFASTDGVSKQLDSLVYDYTKFDGAIKNQLTSLNAQQDTIDLERDELDTRMESIETRYLKQFIAMDQMVYQLQSTSDQLTQALANLSSNS